MNLEQAAQRIVLGTALFLGGCNSTAITGLDPEQKGCSSKAYPAPPESMHGISDATYFGNFGNELAKAVLEDYLSCGELVRPYACVNGNLVIGKPVVSDELQNAKKSLREFRKQASKSADIQTQTLQKILNTYLSNLSANEEKQYEVTLHAKELLDKLEQDQSRGVANCTAHYIADIVSSLLNYEGVLPTEKTKVSWLHAHTLGEKPIPSFYDKRIILTGTDLATITYDSGRVFISTIEGTQEIEIPDKRIVYRLDLNKACMYALHDNIYNSQLENEMNSLALAEKYITKNKTPINQELLKRAIGFIGDCLLRRKPIKDFSSEYFVKFTKAINDLEKIANQNGLSTNAALLRDSSNIVPPNAFFYDNGSVGSEQEFVCQVQVSPDRILYSDAIPDIISGGYLVHQSFDDKTEAKEYPVLPVPNIPIQENAQLSVSKPHTKRMSSYLIPSYSYDNNEIKCIAIGMILGLLCVPFAYKLRNRLK